MILLTLGMSAAAFAALLVAQQAQRHTFERIRLESVVASAVDIAQRLEHNPVETERMLANDRILGARLPPAGIQLTAPDRALSALLRKRIGATAASVGQAQSLTACFPSHRLDLNDQAAGLIEQTKAIVASPSPACWLVRFRDKMGSEHLIAIGLPSSAVPPRATLDPIYIVLIAGASALLALVTAHFATVPLRRLTRAARAFSLSADPEPIAEEGPSEVRTAIATFNLMQTRLSEGFRERTHMLAAISHDLQTPLTRLRLRLEQVQDEALRERLIADLAGTQRLVREGLELARSSENREQWQMVDIDSLLASLAEDAAEFGADVRFVEGCGGSVRTKPDALTRCLTNLIDNAVKYGGGAELRCSWHGPDLEISVRDHGHGLSEEALEQMFEPFVRGDLSRSRATGGTGIGLTIARAQARLLGATVALRNHPGGGLLALVHLSATA